MDYYLVLGVPRTADGDTIRSAYRALARRYHPDAGLGASPEKFRQVVEAYETLGDPVRRRRYDASSPRPRAAPVAEPLFSRGPEPIVQRRPSAAYRPATSAVPLRCTGFAEPLRPADLFSELFRALDELFRP